MQTSKLKGDAGHIAEESFNENNDFEDRCEMIDTALHEGYFTLEQALKGYQVNQVDYLNYLLRKSAPSIRNNSAQKGLEIILSNLLQVYMFNENLFNEPTRRLLKSMREIVPQNLVNR